MSFTRKCYTHDKNGRNLQSHFEEVCCELLAKLDLEYIENSNGIWYISGEGQYHAEIFFCPFCGTKLPKKGRVKVY